MSDLATIKLIHENVRDADSELAADTHMVKTSLATYGKSMPEKSGRPLVGSCALHLLGGVKKFSSNYAGEIANLESRHP
jgi:hypothetical protein